MAFGQKFTRRDSEIEEIRNQKVDDEDDIVENDITGGEVEEEHLIQYKKKFLNHFQKKQHILVDLYLKLVI